MIEGWTGNLTKEEVDKLINYIFADAEAVTSPWVHADGRVDGRFPRSPCHVRDAGIDRPGPFRYQP